MRQIFFTTHNISNLFISPYARIEFEANRTLFINTLTNVVVAVPIDKSTVDLFLQSIDLGLSYQTIVHFFCDNNLSEEWVQKLMQEGILE